MRHLRIPTYIINLKNRADRKAHILNEFKGMDEFSINIVEAHKHEVGAFGLWNTIMHILQNLVNEDDEYILICEDDHQFTDCYSKDLLFSCISQANTMGADILLGGISWVQSIFSLSNSLFWTDKFTATQFVIIFKKFYRYLLECDFGESDTADSKMAMLSTNIFFIYPFISTQKEFGYSDVTMQNGKDGYVNELFIKCANRIQELIDISNVYQNSLSSIEELEDELEVLENIFIPTYVLNISNNLQSLKHINRQFSNKGEFKIEIFNVVNQEGTNGLWEAVREIIRIANSNDDDVIVICSDSHEFTSYYSKGFLIKNIIEANRQSVDILSGSVPVGFNHAILISKNRFWVDYFPGMQFIVIFKSFFEKILCASFDNNEISDAFLSKLTNNKMILYPFISSKRAFEDSEVSGSLDVDSNRLQILYKKSYI